MSYFPPLNTGWELLSSKTLTEVADSISVSSLPRRNYLAVLVNIIAIGNTLIVMRFNNDGGNNYAMRISINGGVDTTVINSSVITIKPSGVVLDTFTTMHIQNHIALEKQFVGMSNFNITLGASSLPSRTIFAGKWANSQDAIESISVLNAGAGDFDIGSELAVLGFGRA